MFSELNNATVAKNNFDSIDVLYIYIHVEFLIDLPGERLSISEWYFHIYVKL